MKNKTPKYFKGIVKAIKKVNKMTKGAISEDEIKDKMINDMVDTIVSEWYPRCDDKTKRTPEIHKFFRKAAKKELSK